MTVDLTRGDPRWPDLTRTDPNGQIICLEQEGHLTHTILHNLAVWPNCYSDVPLFFSLENCFTYHSVFYPPFEVKVQSTSEFVGKLRGVYPSMEFGGAVHQVNLNEKELQKQNKMKFIGDF